MAAANAGGQPLPEAGARYERSNCLACQGGVVCESIFPFNKGSEQRPKTALRCMLGRPIAFRSRRPRAYRPLRAWRAGAVIVVRAQTALALTLRRADL